jgi:anthranilate synthase component 1
MKSRPVRVEAATLLDLHAANPGRYPVLLESTALGEQLTGYDLLLACPGEQLVLKAGQLTSNAPLDLEGTFLEVLDRWWANNRLPDSESSMPFKGGWFVFLGYELGAEIEPSLRLPEQDVQPVANAIRIPAAIIRSHASDEAWLVAEEGSEECLNLMQSDLEMQRPPTTLLGPLLQEPLHEDVPEQFLAAVGAALKHIAAGDIYQANLSRAWQSTLAAGVAPHEVYRRLRRANPGPFAGLAVLGERAIVSSSPERLLEVRNRGISTRPIAGTRPRATNTLADRGLARELRQHPKELAEHVMLLDLERNDLGRVCEAGSIEVDEYMSLETYAHVHHIVSNVRGRLRVDVTPGQAIAAVFPGGTITGCPKIRCMQIIGDLERTSRGVYTGSMGYLNRDGSMDLNILIRTLEITGRSVSFRAGAGIVADSVPERELDETRAKARGMVEALQPAGAA